MRIIKNSIEEQNQGNLLSVDIYFIHAKDLFKKKFISNLPKNAILYISFWDHMDRPFVHNALKHPYAFLKQKEWIKHVFEQVPTKRFEHALFCVGSELFGDDIRFDAELRTWLRWIAREAHRIADKPIFLTHQATTIDEMRYIANLETINFLDVTRAWQAGLSPEKTFRAVSANLHYKKPVIFCIDNRYPKILEKKKQWRDTFRKVIWNGCVGGASGVAVKNKKFLLNQLKKEKKALSKFLSEFSNPFSIERSSVFASHILRAGKYHVRHVSKNEYFLYSSYGGKITVDCSKLKLPVVLRWYNPKTGRFYKNDISLWSRDLALKAPFEGDAAIYMKEGG